MNFFPVSNSTLSAVHLAAFIEQQYRMNGTVSASVIKTGISDTYLVTDNHVKYVFRVYSLNWRSVEEIEAEIKLLSLLQQNGISVSYPLQDVRGNYLQTFNAPEGTRYGVLFSFAEGEKMLNLPEAVHFNAGQLMAQMHLVTQELSLPRVIYTTQVLLVDPMQQLAQFLPADTEEMKYMQRLQQYLLGFFDKNDMSSLRQGMVHLDIWFDNFVVDKNERITLFDFDFCGNGPLVLDIAYYLLQLFSTEKEEAVFLSKKEHFLRGYNAVTQISDEEMALLPAAAVTIYFFYLGVQCSRYDNWSNNFLNEIYLKRFVMLLVKRFADYYKIPANDDRT